jgi:hypothetical protein
MLLQTKKAVRKRQDTAVRARFIEPEDPRENPSRPLPFGWAEILHMAKTGHRLPEEKCTSLFENGQQVRVPLNRENDAIGTVISVGYWFVYVKVGNAISPYRVNELRSVAPRS